MDTKNAKNIPVKKIERVNQWSGTGITFREIYACKLYSERTETFFPDV
jgi:hypothetical protein